MSYYRIKCVHCLQEIKSSEVKYKITPSNLDFAGESKSKGNSHGSSIGMAMGGMGGMDGADNVLDSIRNYR